jgi:hypothetical protein
VPLEWTVVFNFTLYPFPKFYLFLQLLVAGVSICSSSVASNVCYRRSICT